MAVKSGAGAPAANAFGYLCSTIGRKQVMAGAGIVWSLFVLGHALGNLLMFKSAEAYNLYGHAIVSNPLIYFVEFVLVAMLLSHVVIGVILTLRNRASREASYAQTASGEKATPMTTRTMAIQGLVILGFIVLHIITFKYGKVYEVQYGEVVVRDLYRLVYEVFQSPAYVVGYIAALLVLCFHLSHGVFSSLQTLGLHHPKYMPPIKCASVGYGLIVAFAFISQPIYMMFFADKV